jgi:hypothetical protein
MNTLTPQQRLTHVALQLMRSALPLAQTYATHQAELRLELVLSEERLSSLEGLAASMETLARLERLVETHKATWRQWVVETTRQLTTVLEHFPEDERAETSQKLMAVLQWQIEAQHRSVSARAEWIDAAGNICRLAQQGRELEPAANGPVSHAWTRPRRSSSNCSKSTRPGSSTTWRSSRRAELSAVARRSLLAYSSGTVITRCNSSTGLSPITK